MMEKSIRLTNPHRNQDEIDFDATVRPKVFEDFVGQKKIVENIIVAIEAAKMRDEALDHILFHGPPGLGKTTLANLVAYKMEVPIKCTSGPVLERPADLAGILTNLSRKEVLFIDEIHRMNHVVEEYLYPAMEDFSIDIMIEKGPHARSVKLNLEAFTLIGATTRTGLLTAPFRARFGMVSRLDYYQEEDLFKIVRRSAGILGVEIDDGGAYEIAKRSRGTPRVTNRLLRRVRDFAQVKGDGKITKSLASDAMASLEVDEKGLDEMDKKILETIIYKFRGGPVGLATLAVAVGEESETLEEVYEPFLIQEGFIQRTPRGREATDNAYKHFNIKRDEKQRSFL